MTIPSKSDIVAVELVTESGCAVDLGGCAAASSFYVNRIKNTHICQFIFEIVDIRLENERFEQSNATVRWTVACRRLDGGNSLILIPFGNQNVANLDTRTMKYSKKFSPQLAFALLWAEI